MRALFCLILGGYFLTASQSSAQDEATQQAELKSLLGHPFGTYLKIEGTARNDLTGAYWLSVDTIDGKKLTAPAVIWVDNVSALPETERVVLKGYETGAFVGSPTLPTEESEKWGELQLGFQFSHRFIPTTIVAPDSLKFTNPPKNLFGHPHQQEKETVEPLPNEGT